MKSLQCIEKYKEENKSMFPCQEKNVWRDRHSTIIHDYHLMVAFWMIFTILFELFYTA